MHLLVVTPYYKPSWFYGGPPKCIAELNEHLARYHQVRVDVLTLNQNGSNQLYDESDAVTKTVDGVTVHYLPPSRSSSGRWYFSSPALNTWLRKFKNADLVHVNTLFNAFSRKGMQFAIKNNIPMVVTPHGMLDKFSLSRSKWVKKIHRLLYDNRLLSQAAAVHFTTENELNNSETGRVNPVIIPLGFEFPAGEVPHRIPLSGKTRFIFLGRINRKKGIDLLIRGLAGLDTEQRNGITLDIYGNDDENVIPELQALVDGKGLAAVTRFCGAMDPATRDEALLRYDCLVLTSYQENFGLVVTEALARGLPVYISDRVNLCHFVADNHCGWVSSLSVSDISKTLRTIHETDHSLRIHKGANGFSAVRKAFSIETVSKQYVELYRKVAGKGDGRQKLEARMPVKRQSSAAPPDGGKI